MLGDVAPRVCCGEHLGVMVLTKVEKDWLDEATRLGIAMREILVAPFIPPPFMTTYSYKVVIHFFIQGNKVSKVYEAKGEKPDYDT